MSKYKYLSSKKKNKLKTTKKKFLSHIVKNRILSSFSDLKIKLRNELYFVAIILIINCICIVYLYLYCTSDSILHLLHYIYGYNLKLLFTVRSHEIYYFQITHYNIMIIYICCILCITYSVCL